MPPIRLRSGSPGRIQSARIASPRTAAERCGRIEREDAMNSDLSMGRRDVIMAAGAGLATSLLAGATAEAQTPAAAQTAGDFWTAEYSAKKGDVSLAIYRKRI